MTYMPFNFGDVGFSRPYEKSEAKGYYFAKKKNSPDSVFLMKMVDAKGRTFIDYDYQALQGYHEDLLDKKQEKQNRIDNILYDITRRRRDIDNAPSGLFGLGMKKKNRARRELDNVEREARAARYTVQKEYQDALLTNKLPLINYLATRIKRRETKAGATEQGMVRIFDKVRGSYA